jgi:hypothetical protein
MDIYNFQRRLFDKWLRADIRKKLCFRTYRPGALNLYLLKGHILMAEKFAGRIRVLQSKVCVSLQDMPTNISLHKHTYDSFVVLFIYLWFMV